MPRAAAVVAFVLAAAYPASAVELFSGVSRQVKIPAQDEPTLFSDFTFAVPAGARWAVVEATTGDPAADIDLYAKFGARTQILANGKVESDHASETPAGIDEHIFINPLSQPPLETGVYYVGLLVNSTDLEFTVTLKVTIELGGELSSFRVSTFDSGTAEGWTLNFPGGTLPGATPGDSSANLATPGAVLRVADFEGPNRDFVVAPQKFLGDLGQFADPRFEFELLYAAGPEPVFPVEMRIYGAGGSFLWRGPRPPDEESVLYEVPLFASEWRRLAGTASFADVLRNVARIELSMEHAVGPEINELNFFSFRGEAPAPPPPGSGREGLSDFEQGVDGWTRNFPASAIPGASIGTENAAVQRGVGGYQSEGFLLMIDGDGRNQDWAVAPPKFIQGLTDLDRPWYEFRYRRISGAFPRHDIRVQLVGGGSIYLWDGPRSRDDSWERMQVPVDRKFWVLFSGPDDWDNMLRNVQRLEISMDNADGPEVNGIDDFYLRTQYTPPVGRALHVDRTEIEVQALIGGPAPAPEPLRVTATGDELVWQATIDPPQAASWLELSKAGGGTPDALEIRLKPDQLPPGLFTAEVIVSTDEFGVRSPRVKVTFVVGADPRVPLLSQGGAVHAADPLVALSPGALGSVFGQFLAPVDVIPGLTDGRLPLSAGGVEVKLFATDGTLIARAPLLFAGPSQINFQTPYEAAGRNTVLLAVCRDGAESNRLPVALAPAAPGIFVLPNQQAAVLNQDGSLNSPASPARAGEFVTAFFSGAGEVSPAIETGRTAPVEPLHIPVGGLTATVGGRDVPVINAALTPNFVGLAQMSLRIVPGLGAGRTTLTIAVAGRRSNSVTIWVAE